MSAHANPDIVDDSLVFIYDTDDGKSFKGEPTVNLATDSPSQGGWAGGREVLDSSRKKFRFIVDNFNASAGSGQGWRSFTWDLNSYSGQSVTISATVEVPSASPGTFAWIMMGQTNTHTSNNSGAGQYMGYSASSERVQKTTTTTEHITWTGTVGSTGTASQPSGHVEFTLWYNVGTIGVDSYVELSNVLREINFHATQFVNGTRSATQGLLDRTGTSTIDISNASFDSNAQMTFDGTDDYFEISDPNVSSSDGFSVELIIKPDNPTSSPAVIVPNSGGIDHWIRFDGNGRLYIRMIPAANSGGQNFITSTELSSGNYHHVVFTFKQSEGGKAYYNGALETSAAATLTALDWSGIWRIGQRGNNTWFLEGELPMLKIYNKTLTTSEVLQNFNATKSRFGL